ncbi:hypothetical protein HFC70_17410, partial [Agrobacterium sp. a22-2]|nr:hypothetical protein [Agrobacterium sp. a22-2]
MTLKQANRASAFASDLLHPTRELPVVLLKATLWRLWRMARWLSLLAAVWLLGEQGLALYRTGITFGLVDPVRLAEYRLYMAGSDRFVAEIEAAIAAEDYGYAEDLCTLATRYGHDLPPDLRERAVPGFATRAFVSSSRAARGFVFGSFDSGEEIAGSVASDLVGVGDLRDFSVQGVAYMAGRDYDPLLLGLSAAGLGLTAATYGSAGAGALPDAGLSLLKNAYRARKLSRPLTTYLTKTATRVVDMKVLRRELTAVADEGVTGLGKVRNAAAKSLDKTAARTLLDDAEVLGDIGKRGGARASVAALSIADGPKDLRKLQRVTRHFGSESSTVLKFLGKTVLKLGYGLYAFAAALASLALTLLWIAIKLPARLALRMLGRRLGLGE